jgi:hypothetical protein
VADFLFEYYAFRPSYLRKWSPGYGVVLEGESASEFEQREHFGAVDGGVALRLEKTSERFAKRTAWIHDMLCAAANRPALYGCFGLHEWAMLYRSPLPRHDSVQLRVSADQLAEIVEKGPLNCTHFDAFRFFTPEAAPLNARSLSRDDMSTTEQTGCLHVNMDIYRWAFKRYPWVPSELILDAFELALEIRHLDMAASPYDLSESGIEPVRVEEPEGRQRYLEGQKRFNERAMPLREALISAYSRVLKGIADLHHGFANTL